MSTRLSHTLSFSAPLAEVSAMLADPRFREQVADGQGATERTVTTAEEGGDTVVRIDMRQVVRQVPSAIAKLIGEDIRIVQEERWGAADRAEASLTTPKLPARIHGTSTLSESGGVTTQQVELEVKASVPLIGGKLEKVIADLLERALNVQQRTAATWLG